jgi:ferredoxin-NADP reductase
MSTAICKEQMWNGTGTAPALQVQVSEPAGKGFPLEKVPPSEVDTMLIFATGTGISPIKALIDADALQAKERKDVRLYYGTHDIAHTAYADRCGAHIHMRSCSC